ncbi:hypothetical protein SKAU_G00030850 [Synaphobranchus kaupii]|uniref:Uncharacterized protein n=1 Tax=Synaphobranchus kaupii TaxID=118154 RepID=A0A9Q1GFJ6_SYNKA|nr:hypothetical protein SKAU_G00030850 [Synaphobranchus kaupii]
MHLSARSVKHRRQSWDLTLETLEASGNIGGTLPFTLHLQWRDFLLRDGELRTKARRLRRCLGCNPARRSPIQLCEKKRLDDTASQLPSGPWKGPDDPSLTQRDRRPLSGFRARALL